MTARPSAFAYLMGARTARMPVISAADGRSTIYGTLGGRYVDGKIENMYKNWETIRPMVMISFGVAREFPGAGVPPVSVHWPSCGSDSLLPGGKTLQDNSPMSRPVACGLPPQPQGVILRVAGMVLPQLSDRDPVRRSSVARLCCSARAQCCSCDS